MLKTDTKALTIKGVVEASEDNSDQTMPIKEDFRFTSKILNNHTEPIFPFSYENQIPPYRFRISLYSSFFAQDEKKY